jgi:hypothetical protein
MYGKLAHVVVHRFRAVLLAGLALFLLLTLAFETWSCLAVAFETSRFNARSREANGHRRLQLSIRSVVAAEHGPALHADFEIEVRPDRAEAIIELGAGERRHLVVGAGATSTRGAARGVARTTR